MPKFLPELDVQAVREMNKRAWNYATLVRAAPLPVCVLNEDNVAGRQQQDRGTCVGQSTASLMDYLHIGACGEAPAGHIVRDLRTPDGVVHDQLYVQSFSAECAYQHARARDGLNGSDGAYVHSSVRALYEEGVCLESQWFTGKTVGKYYKTGAPATLPTIATECARHKISGYASITTLQELKQALAERRVCIGAINVYDNYDAAGKGHDGLYIGYFPMPGPSNKCIGAHALCFIGYDDTTKKLTFRQSWAGFAERGTIDYEYWEKYGSDFFVCVDEHEVAIATTVYKYVHVDSNVSGANVAIYEGDSLVTQGVVPFDVNLIVGKQYKVILTNGVTQQATSVTVGDDTTTIRVVASETPTRDWLTLVTEFILRILGVKKS